MDRNGKARRSKSRRKITAVHRKRSSRNPIEWVDPEGYKRESGGAVLHKAVLFRGERFDVGHTVLLRHPDDSCRPYVARIIKLVDYPNEGPAVIVRWFYRGDDTAMRVDQTETQNAQEVYLSTATDENDISSLDGHCIVLTKREYLTQKQDEDDDDVYYCCRFYDSVQGKLSPLTAGQEAAIMSGSADFGTGPTKPHDENEDEISDWDSDDAADGSSKRKRKNKRRGPSGKRPKTRPKFNMPRARVEDRTQSDPFDLLRDRLHVAAVPDTLPCREAEFCSIFEFVRDQLNAGLGGCLFVSGVPGTGKTATIRSVARALEKDRDEGKLIPFDFIEINGMALTAPNQAYVELWHAVSGTSDRKVPPAQALDLLRKRFTTPSPRRQCTVVLVDELDQLWTRKQDVLYNLFDWPNHRHSRLVVVAVANTMDLPERVLVHRVSSRIGLQRLPFQSYNRVQLATIIKIRAGQMAEFSGDAVELCARKVAAVSGDARRALDICRRAAELAQIDGTGVTLSKISAAIAEMTSSPMIVAMERASVHEKLLLVAIVCQFRKTGVEETTFADVLEAHTTFCRYRGIDPPSASTIASVCARLGACRLLLIEPGEHDVHQRIRLNCNQDDVLYALRQDETVKKLQ